MINISVLCVLCVWGGEGGRAIVTSRVVVPKENLGDGLRAILAWVACRDDSGDVVFHPFDSDRPSIDEHNNNGLQLQSSKHVSECACRLLSLDKTLPCLSQPNPLSILLVFQEV